LTNVPTVFLIEPDGAISVVCNGFDKKGLEEIGASLAERQHVAAAPLFHADERIPDHKPG
jgi:hypothetical protein